MSTLIGLTGKAGAGKGVVADYLVEKHGFTKLSFAAPLKKMLRTLDPILGVSDGEIVPLSNLLGEMPVEKGWTELNVKAAYPEYRRLLQALGTDCIRAMDEDFWVRAAGKQITDPFDGKWVFDDCRFPNEAFAIEDGFSWLSLKGTTWNIIREGHDGGGGSHASEQWAGKLGEDFHLPNDGTMEDLYRQVDQILGHLDAS